MNFFFHYIRHFFLIGAIFFVSVLIRYPLLINSDHFFTVDEAVIANTILGLLNGDPVIFYYDYHRYFGLTFGLASVPFMWVLGVNVMAFQLAATLFYSLYVWTTYLLARILVPRTALLVLMIMLVTPPHITMMSAHNWPHIPAAFFGNIIFLLFIKAKITEKNRGAVVFFLFFSMGLSIYTYTFSLIYISVIAILYLLSHPKWSEFRERISLTTMIDFFREKGTKRQRISRFLDVLLFIFFSVIVFSYVFGGFAIDVGGVSIFQVKNFHKPALQIVGILLLRIAIYRNDLVFIFKGIKTSIFDNVSMSTRRLVRLGTIGFCLGLSPRIASILTGETSRGGQGFDTDVLPTKLVAHFWDMISRSGLQLFGFDGFFWSLISGFDFFHAIILLVLFFLLVALLVSSGVYFFSNNWMSVRKILSLKAISFQPHHIFILLPVLICAANIIVENGSQPRYLFPLFGTFVLWIGWFLSKIQQRIKWFPIFALIVWVAFYSLENYQYQKSGDLIDGVTPLKLEKHKIHEVVEFLESNSIRVAYSHYGVCALGTFLSAGKINISEYNVNPRVNSRKERSMSADNFAIITEGDSTVTYINFLKDSNIMSKVNKIGIYKVFWNFSGDAAEINKLRSLITDNSVT